MRFLASFLLFSFIGLCFALKIQRKVRTLNIASAESSAIVSRTALYTSSSKTEADPQRRSWWQRLMFWKSNAAAADGADSSTVLSRSPRNAVLVFGGTGRAGREIVKSCLESGRDVVVAARNSTRVEEVFADYDNDNKSNLFVYSGIDVTNRSTLPPSLFDGVDQLVSALGPVFGDSKLTAEAVDYRALTSIVDLFKQAKTSASTGAIGAEMKHPLVSFAPPTKSDTMKLWSRLDDAIMGGRSSSYWESIDWKGEGSDFARWTGRMITDGGGFCGTVIRDLPFSSKGFDGVYVRVRGDGNRYKFRLKTAAGSDSSFQYQSSFDTTPNQWTEVRLPFHSFIALRRNDVMHNAGPVNQRFANIPFADAIAAAASATTAVLKQQQSTASDAAVDITGERSSSTGEASSSDDDDLNSVGIFFSKFEYDGLPNPSYTPGSFSLDVKEIGLYRSPRPQVVLVSAAGTERINRLSTDSERARDVPIVQLNPQGILNWKYKGEDALRKSGLKYCIIRCTGLVQSTGANPPATTAAAATAVTVTTPSPQEAASPAATAAVVRKFEASQGDRMAGRITRTQLAQAVTAALESPYSEGKTMEVRSDESDSGVVGAANWDYGWPLVYPESVFYPLVKDTERATRGLPPLPYPYDPPAPVSEERLKEILADPRVRAAQERDRAESK